MPRSRKTVHSSKPGSSKANTTAPIPLLDSLRAQSQTPAVENPAEASPHDHVTLGASAWKYEPKDWSLGSTSDRKTDKFPASLRSIERKALQKTHPFSPTNTSESDENTSLDEPSPESFSWASTDKVDIRRLSLIVHHLFSNDRYQTAYDEFLVILQHYSVRCKRDDHLEETVYHLIQAAVTYIRRHAERFDLSKLDECYRQRHILRTNAT